MKAMILAAGRGERLRPLTDTIPKPLVQAGKYSLIEWHIKHLAESGISDIVINTSHLAGQIHDALGSGQGFDVNISYSDEPEGALETGEALLDLLRADERVTSLLDDAALVALFDPGAYLVHVDESFRRIGLLT